MHWRVLNALRVIISALAEIISALGSDIISALGSDIISALGSDIISALGSDIISALGCEVCNSTLSDIKIYEECHQFISALWEYHQYMGVYHDLCEEYHQCTWVFSEIAQIHPKLNGIILM